MKAVRTRQVGSPGTAGFTLTEILIVIGVLIALMGIVTVVVTSSLDSSRDRAKGEMMLLADAVDKYREMFGEVLPPGFYWDEDDEFVEQEGVEDVLDSVTIEPSPSTDDEESSAVLFFFLTNTFETNSEGDPGMVGRLGESMGPCLSPEDLKAEMVKNPAVLDEEFEEIDIKVGYEGVATWFIDPWGNPYRYIIKNDGQDFDIESAGPDGEFGDPFDRDDPGCRDNILLSRMNR